MTLLQHVAIDPQNAQEALCGIVQKSEVRILLCHGIMHDNADVHVLGNDVAEYREHHHPPKLLPRAHAEYRGLHRFITVGSPSTITGTPRARAVLNTKML